MVEIHHGSEAFNTLSAMMKEPDTYKVSVEIRTDGIALKRNESMWTPTLSVRNDFN